MSQNEGLGPPKRPVLRMRGIETGAKLKFGDPSCTAKLLFHGCVWGPMGAKDAEKLRAEFLKPYREATGEAAWRANRD
eukprot:3859015-Pyramimonas_sp.AAC.1